jgi:ABC-type nitrate/sulfonate/bicarbonate transport system substrate-binding protein
MSAQPVVATPSRTLFALPFWVALHRGFFRDEGLKPSLAFIGSGDAIIAGLRDGSITMAISPPDGIMLDVLAGGPLRIFGGNACKPPLFVIAQPEIRTASELRGKTFGVLSLREGSSKFIAKIAKAGGLASGDYRIVEVGGAPARVKLLIERAIDVGLQPMPLNYELEARGFTNLGWTGEFEPHYQFTSINANRDWAAREPLLAVAMLRALLRAQRFIAAEPGEAAAVASAELGCESGHAAQAIHDSARLGIFDPNLDWSAAGLERIFLNLQDDRALPANTAFEIERYVSGDALRAAQASCRASFGQPR